MSQPTQVRVRALPVPGGRIPPHDLIAEASLLGAMLLSQAALGAGAETCSVADFYKPAHAQIFEAILALDSVASPRTPPRWPTSCAGAASSTPSAAPPRW